MAEADLTRSALLRASKPITEEFFSTLITANNILHHQHVLDADGEVSVRNPQDPNKFFLATARIPAALVSSREDIREYLVSDGSRAVADGDGDDDDDDGGGDAEERFIHSEIYKRYNGVHSVVHAHSEVVIPFSIGSTPLRPVSHTGAVTGSQVPVFDIALHYNSDSNRHNMRVNNPHLGASLATGLHPPSVLSKTTNLIKNVFVSPAPSQAPDFPSHPVVLMRGHGFTCIGQSIQEAVYRAVYTCRNARIQTSALLMQGTYNIGLLAERFRGGETKTGPAEHENIKYLSDREVKDASSLDHGNVMRAWSLWSEME